MLITDYKNSFFYNSISNLLDNSLILPIHKEKL